MRNIYATDATDVTDVWGKERRGASRAPRLDVALNPDDGPIQSVSGEENWRNDWWESTCARSRHPRSRSGASSSRMLNWTRENKWRRAVYCATRVACASLARGSDRAFAHLYLSFYLIVHLTNRRHSPSAWHRPTPCSHPNSNLHIDTSTTSTLIHHRSSIARGRCVPHFRYRILENEFYFL